MLCLCSPGSQVLLGWPLAIMAHSFCVGVRHVLMVQNCTSCPLLSMTLIGSSYCDGMCTLLDGCMFTTWGWDDLSRKQMRSPKDSRPYTPTPA